jgi:hypothetical protein
MRATGAFVAIAILAGPIIGRSVTTRFVVKLKD